MYLVARWAEAKCYVRTKPLPEDNLSHLTNLGLFGTITTPFLRGSSFNLLFPIRPRKCYGAGGGTAAIVNRKLSG